MTVKNNCIHSYGFFFWLGSNLLMLSELSIINRLFLIINKFFRANFLSARCFNYFYIIMTQLFLLLKSTPNQIQIKSIVIIFHIYYIISFSNIDT